MPVNDELGLRMKNNYENRAKTYLIRRMPVAVRIDGRAFHTFTKHFDKPFDSVLMTAMQETMKYLCANVEGCVFGYTQSDEITLILVDYKNLSSNAFFDYNVQKVCSVTASMATKAFNKFFTEIAQAYMNATMYIPFEDDDRNNKEHSLCNAYAKAIEQGAEFDSRCFNIPKEEVTNLIYWRQLDATRNSIQMVGHANFSHKQLQNKSCNDIQDMLMLEKGINWNDFPVYCKRGTSCRKRVVHDYDEYGNDWNHGVCEWTLDLDMPILKGEDRKFVDNLILIGEQ